MKDMGMGGHDMGTMDHGAMQGMGNGAAGAQAGSMAGMDHSAMNHGAGAGSMQGMNHSQMNHGTAAAAAGGMAGMAMPQGQSGTMAGMDHGSGAMPGMAGDQSMAGMDMGGMDMGNMNMRDFSKAPEVKKGRAFRPSRLCRWTAPAIRVRGWRMSATAC
jgi:hypothetical protein